MAPSSIMAAAAPSTRSPDTLRMAPPTAGSTGFTRTPPPANAAPSTSCAKRSELNGAPMVTKTAEAYELSRWSLDDLFPGHESSEMKAALKQLENEVAAIEKQRDKLTDAISEKDFLDILRHMEKNTRLASRVGQFAGLWFTEDTQDQVAQSFQAKIDQLMAELQNRTLFFILWWRGAGDGGAARHPLPPP